MNICNLHLQTAVGSLESTVLNSQIVGLDLPVVCTMDMGLFNAIDFYETCINNNIKPVIGLNCFVSWGDVDSMLMNYNTMYNEIGLIAINRTGYENLIKLSTYSYLKGFYQKPRIDMKTLAQHNDGLICLIDSTDSGIAMHISNGQDFKAKDLIKEYEDMFGDKLYTSVFANKVPVYLGGRCVATNKVKYVSKDEYTKFKYMWAINHNIGFDVMDVEDIYSYKTYEEIMACGWITDDHVGNLYELLDRIEDYKLDREEIHLPSAGMTNEDFVALMEDKLVKLGWDTSQYRERLYYELATITNFGYVNYFMLVADIIKYCNDELSGYISAGRGSVGGSLVARLLDITRIDPVNPQGFGMGIPFDRFLNAGRKVMPDIDLDFLPKDRQAVITYLKSKYGDDSVKNMVTITTLGARSAIREVCRISGHLTPDIENIIKSFPKDQTLTLQMVKESDIYEKNKNNMDFVYMFDIAEQLEGIPKSFGVHASGIALSSYDMNKNVPFFQHNDREITQFTQDQLDYMGVVKLDILGLNALQVVSDALKMINPDMSSAMMGEWLNGIPIDDEEVYNFINSTNITGVFQWDTHNYKNVIEQVHPLNFKELVDLNTLGRSAALISGLTGKYIKRKNNIEVAEPLHPKLAGLMNQTYGLPLYQEQIMDIFVKLGDYTTSEADDVRKAIGKKIPELLVQQKVKFMIQTEMSESEVEDLWNIIEKFSKYTWNLGHAMSYTRICYETAYLACHYPNEYYCAYINNSASSEEAGNYISVLKKRGIKVGGVDINDSQVEYKVVDGKILAGFKGLKFMGDKRLVQFMDLRGDGFKDFDDFDKRVPKKTLNKQALESLCLAGAFDKWISKDTGVIEKVKKRLGHSNMAELKEDQYRKCGRVMFDMGGERISNLTEKENVEVIAYVVKFREIYTKKQQKMAFCQIEDVTGRYEITIFPKIWESCKIKTGLPYRFVLTYDKGLMCYSVKEYLDSTCPIKK